MDLYLAFLLGFFVFSTLPKVGQKCLRHPSKEGDLGCFGVVCLGFRLVVPSHVTKFSVHVTCNDRVKNVSPLYGYGRCLLYKPWG